MIGQTLSHYCILEQIGAGGMGVVYRARDEQLDRDVAVKVLPAGTLSDDSARRRFHKEAVALAKLNHPNIETVYEFDTQDGMDFLVMEYVPGQTLAKRLIAGSLPSREVIALALQISEALAEAHERGVVHCDLKPANIAVTAKGQAKVLDFGLATLLRPISEVTTSSLAATRAGAGTLPYMSPEQLRGEPVDARADIYALGTLLYEIATSRRAFEDEMASRLIEAILHQPPVPPRAVNRRIPAELERIILKCLDKNPERRYQSAKELMVDLRRLGAPGSESTVPSMPRAWTRRKTMIRMAYGMAGLFTLATALAWLNPGGWRARLFHSVRGPEIRSLAVLPLEDGSGGPGHEYFADGMTDELTTELAKIGSLKVISQTSSKQFKNTGKPLPEIGRILNVDAIVEGSVQRVGDRVRINARLIQTRNDRGVWVGGYERDLRDVLALQREVAEAIASSIAVSLKSDEKASLQNRPSVNPAAHEAYLKGRYYWNKRTPQGLKKALKSFQEAVAIDPQYALAYAGLSDTYAFAAELGLPTKEAKEKQKAAALRALELDDSLAEAHTSLGEALEADWDWSGAEAQYKRAIELNPNYATARHWYSGYLSVLGRHEESIAQAKHALELDPLSLIIQANLGGRYLYAGRYEEAVRECRKALEMDSNFFVAHDCVGFARLQQGRPEEAIAEFRAANQLSQGNPQSISALGYAYAVSGRAKESLKIARQLKGSSSEKYLPAYHIAIVEAGLGRKSEAITWLERAFASQSAELPWAKTEPMLASLRGEPRFQDLLRRMGLSR